jgi:hypothetical protein
MKRKLSYTKRRWDKKTPFHNLIPFNVPILFVSIISMLKPSTTMRNDNGERGQPYLNPLPRL